jgi:hypothetical protein
MVEYLSRIAQVEIAAARRAAHEMFGFVFWLLVLISKRHGAETRTGGTVVESALSSQQLRQLGEVHRQQAREQFQSCSRTIG